jgi:hypothetical protein
MHRVRFRAYGHHNVISEHNTTIEITTEDFLTKTGTCIIGIKSSMNLKSFDDEIKHFAQRADTVIILSLNVNGICEKISGYGDPGLTYEDSISMVTRKSDYTCDRTLMVRADKAASNLNHEFVEALKNDQATIECEIVFLSE